MSGWMRMVPAFLALTLLMPCAVYSADEKPGDEPAATSSPAPSADDIAALVKQLDSDKFQDRQDASDKLSEIGKPAIEALAKAATGESLEVTVRSIDILKKLLESSDEPTKAAAKSALEKIAKCDRPSAARRAEDALKLVEEQAQPANAFAPGAIQIAVAGGGAKRISVRTVNGVKTIEADEGDRKVKIVDDPKNGIKMEVTETKNGKQTTEKYEAKNAEELKKKHAKAYEIYKKYSQQGGNVIVQMQVGGKLPIRVARPVPAVQPRRVNTVDMAARMLPAWGSSLKRLASDEAIKQASDKSRKDLKKKVADLKEQLTDIEKRLQQAIEKAEKEEAEKPKDQSEPEAEEPAVEPK